MVAMSINDVFKMLEDGIKIIKGITAKAKLKATIEDNKEVAKLILNEVKIVEHNIEDMEDDFIPFFKGMIIKTQQDEDFNDAVVMSGIKTIIEFLKVHNVWEEVYAKRVKEK